MRSGMKHTLCAAIALLALPLSAIGQQVPPPDYEIAREAVARGEILPLAQVLATVQERHPGTVVEVELEYGLDSRVYEVELVTGDGRLIEVDVDAVTGLIVDVDEDDG